MAVFQSADILLPQGVPWETWAVVACDQFTSQPEYWEAADAVVGSAPSALRLILPEVYLSRAPERIPLIHKAMRAYREGGLFAEFPRSFVLVERTLKNGSRRLGVVGAVDLEAYDAGAGSRSPVRASEQTVPERVPPRMRVRQNAPLELTHVLLLADDAEEPLIPPLAAAAPALPLLYDFELMLGGGHVRGRLITGEPARDFQARLNRYAERKASSGGPDPLLFAVGDGNHSLAAAKVCYEEQKRSEASSPARYALVELESLHDPSLVFAPIHRLVTGVRPKELLARLREAAVAEGGLPLRWVSGAEEGEIRLSPALHPLCAGALQAFLGRETARHGGRVDYIHGEGALRSLAAKEGAVGFLLPAPAKENLFAEIAAHGPLPRKTFSMGEAEEKRYYIEARAL